ncbi:MULTISPECIES: ABC transporter permease [unclassified Inquilinus]|uniref:ABC transporter permease n=1 Tax=unclassified Inquilinus TaxID=2645927 RepID=UPI003F904BE5
MAGLSVQRLAGLVRKEVLQILRDPSSVMIALVMPVVLLLLNGFGLSLDARDVPFGVVIESPSPDTAGLYAAFANSGYLRATAYRSAGEAETALTSREIRGFAVLRGDFSRQAVALQEPARIQLIVDGVDANTARLVEGYAGGAIRVWLGGLEGRRAAAAPLILELRNWFNPQLRSTDFIVPGLIALIMTLIGALLTALVVSREWERGTMEALLVTPVRTIELQLGKLIAYFGLGLAGLAVSLALAIFLFQVPFRGSFGALLLVSAVFLLSALGMGLLISTWARNQFVAAQIAFIVTYMPAVILSGLLFDIASMPGWVQAVTRVVAARYYVDALQTLFLAGDVWPVLLPDLAAMGGFAAFFFAVTLINTRRRLD